MKTYTVITQSGINEMLLHSIQQERFVTTSYEEAEGVYNKEIEVIAKEYINAKDLEYTPTDEESNHAIYCQIVSVEDGEDPVFEKTSDSFYE